MEVTLGKEYGNLSERETFLKDNCDKAEKKGYNKPFSEEEMQKHKENLSELSIEIEEVEESKKSSTSYHNSRLKDLKERRTKAISNIKSKSEYVSEVCYKFVDRDARITGYYNAEGLLVEQRTATAEELSTIKFDSGEQQEDDARPIRYAYAN
jgi:uncharacterized DUF497 family protein